MTLSHPVVNLLLLLVSRLFVCPVMLTTLMFSVFACLYYVSSFNSCISKCTILTSIIVYERTAVNQSGARKMRQPVKKIQY